MTINLNDTDTTHNNEIRDKYLKIFFVAAGIIAILWVLINWRQEAAKTDRLTHRIEELETGMEGRSFIFVSNLDSLILESSLIYRFDKKNTEWKTETQQRLKKLIRAGSHSILLDRQNQPLKGIFATISVTDPISGFQEQFSLCPMVGDSLTYLPFSNSFESAYYKYRRRK